MTADAKSRSEGPTSARLSVHRLAGSSVDAYYVKSTACFAGATVLPTRWWPSRGVEDALDLDGLASHAILDDVARPQYDQFAGILSPP
jgi:hypothetical protein